MPKGIVHIQLDRAGRGRQAGDGGNRPGDEAGLEGKVLGELEAAKINRPPRDSRTGDTVADPQRAVAVEKSILAAVPVNTPALSVKVDELT